MSEFYNQTYFGEYFILSLVEPLHGDFIRSGFNSRSSWNYILVFYYEAVSCDILRSPLNYIGYLTLNILVITLLLLYRLVKKDDVKVFFFFQTWMFSFDVSWCVIQVYTQEWIIIVSIVADKKWTDFNYKERVCLFAPYFRYRQTVQTPFTLESTHHAIVRALLQLEEPDRILEMLKDKVVLLCESSLEQSYLMMLLILIAWKFKILIIVLCCIYFYF